MQLLGAGRHAVVRPAAVAQHLILRGTTSSTRTPRPMPP